MHRDLCVFPPQICSPGTSLAKLPRRSEPKPGAWLILLTWALNLAESWGGVSLPNTLHLGLCDRKMREVFCRRERSQLVGSELSSEAGGHWRERGVVM